ncbi:flagellar motor protein MotB [Flavobacterium faecale]|uniref:Flagellar motor protein MotB n=1 Tax=Flavobacterium faecale TaxID=1355330 RepID=A0A2S1LAH6_9FLAO|nr:OmpA family protein [Flavobacterium faecale]AWG20688.1 flagellar motor protein MotB [Flavobacterium faecale]
MKKLIITLVFASAFTGVNAQNEAKKENETEKYNKWSIEVAGGVSKPLNRLGGSFGFVTPVTVDLGLRYMINNKFGIKGDLGYNTLQEKDGAPEFNSRYYRGDIQAVANLGRIMNFETWTNTIGLLGHGGVGLGMVRSGDVKDWVGNGILGLTLQAKLSDHFALTMDGSAILNVRQDLLFTAAPSGKVGYGGILNGTVGVTYYIGKNTKHADWIVLDSTNGLEKRVSELEAMNADTDRDGIVDYLDLEPNTMSGAMVDGKGRAIDANKNGIPDEIEKYIDAKYKGGNGSGVSDDTIKGLVNGGYVSVFFDFNKSTPNTESTDAVAYVLTYLRNNPSASVDIIGHADEVGSTSYNNNLSSARANNVKETLLKSNIAASRLNVVAAGEDTSVDVNSDAARKLVRRVSFMIK